MEEISQFFDFFTKLLYGTHLSAAFSGMTIQKNWRSYFALMLLVSVLHNTVYILFGTEITLKVYPFLIHLPIVIYLHKKWMYRFSTEHLL